MPLMIIWTDEPPVMIEVKNAHGEVIPTKGVELLVTRDDLFGFSGDALMKRYFEPALKRIQRMFDK